ncbi:MAG: PLD nuclease N-terminal domain-containing protein [Nanoarchaeota archaeon]|nr:PLD nuclease N-terminal domain-containing protein [Nanoarchaeota archaeon]
MIPLLQQMAPETGAALGFGMILAIFLIIIIAVVFFVFLFIFWVWMIIDCVKRKMDDTEKVVWVLLMVFLGALASIIYYFVVYREAKKRKS